MSWEISALEEDDSFVASKDAKLLLVGLRVQMIECPPLIARERDILQVDDGSKQKQTKPSASGPRCRSKRVNAYCWAPYWAVLAKLSFLLVDTLSMSGRRKRRERQGYVKDEKTDEDSKTRTSRGKHDGHPVWQADCSPHLRFRWDPAASEHTSSSQKVALLLSQAPTSKHSSMLAFLLRLSSRIEKLRMAFSALN